MSDNESEASELADPIMNSQELFLGGGGDFQKSEQKFVSDPQSERETDAVFLAMSSAVTPPQKEPIEENGMEMKSQLLSFLSQPFDMTQKATAETAETGEEDVPLPLGPAAITITKNNNDDDQFNSDNLMAFLSGNFAATMDEKPPESKKNDDNEDKEEREDVEKETEEQEEGEEGEEGEEEEEEEEAEDETDCSSSDNDQVDSDDEEQGKIIQMTRIVSNA